MPSEGGFGRAHLLSEIIRLEEHTHALSNSVGMTMNLLIQSATEKDTDLFYDRLATATELAMKATGTLQVLMWDLQHFRRELEHMPEKHTAGTFKVEDEGK